MARRTLNPRLRQIVMQGALVLVFGAAVGLAALVTRYVRVSMRVELGEAQTFGRLVARLPAKWVGGPVGAERGDAVEAEEPPGDQQPGRRLRLGRQRTNGLVPPLEHLLRSGQVTADVLKALADGREGYSVSNVTVGGWPGQMVTAVWSPRPGVVHKDVVACATLPMSQALVVRLEGVGPLDASDRELVKQMGENVSLAGQEAAPDAAGATVDVVDEIRVEAPAHYAVVRNDDSNQLQRQLLFDGSRGAAGSWVAVDLVSCVFFADDTDETFVAMLAARDSEWRPGGPGKRLGPGVMTVERADGAGGGGGFASRAYLKANADGRALLVVMRGGGVAGGDRRMFDAAWQAISSGARFVGSKDLSGLLVNGAEGVRGLAKTGLAARAAEWGKSDWFVWDRSENAYKVEWSTLGVETVQAAPDGPVVAVKGARKVWPLRAYGRDTQFEQAWTVSADLSTYQVTTTREVLRAVVAGGGRAESSRPTLEQRVGVEGGRVLSMVGRPAAAEQRAPAQFVPGGVLPLVMRDLADKPALYKTESFVGLDVAAPAGLLTLFVTRLTDAPQRHDEHGATMDCVSVSVNGSGVVSRWYYAEGEGMPRAVDFAGGVRAGGDEGVAGIGKAEAGNSNENSKDEIRKSNQ